MSRRGFTLAARGASAVPLAAQVQPAGRVYRIGWLAPAPVPSTLEGFRAGLRALGYVEGNNFVIVQRCAIESEPLAGLAAELVAARVDVFVASSVVAAQAAKNMAGATPVVFVTGNPVATGLVASLARPGGNLTGLSLINTGLDAKRLQLLKELLPKVSRVGVLTRPQRLQLVFTELEVAARSLGLEIVHLEVRVVDDIEPALNAAAKDRVGALLTLSSPLFNAEKQRIVRLAAKLRLPAIYEARDFTEVGGLLSYGPDISGVFSACGGLCRQDPQRGQAGRPSRRAADEGRAGHQPEDCQCAGADVAPVAAAAGRRGDSMNRRGVLVTTMAAALGGALAMPPAHGQARKALRRVGVLRIGDPAAGSTGSQDLIDALQQQGFVDGRDIVIEARSAEGRTEGLARVAAELAALKPAVIVTYGPQATQAVLAASPDAPVVAILGEFVALGFAAGLARPGGRVSGVNFLGTPLNAKHLELLAELLPKGSAVLNLGDPGTRSLPLVEGIAATASTRGLVSHTAYASTPQEIDAAFATARRLRVAGVNVLGSPFLDANRVRIIDLASKARLPAIYQWPRTARAGGLMAYGPSNSAIDQQLATYVVRILNGAKAGDLPIEQPTRFELVINLKTAKALGLTIPQSLLLRADEVIQ